MALLWKRARSVKYLLHLSRRKQNSWCIRKDINNQCPVESINPRDYGMMNGERALAQAKQLIADFYA